MADIERKPVPPTPDAGLRNLDHYKLRLPKYRYILRQKILPLVRWETPYLAYVQEHVRTPALDTYFAMSANLGTHTFFIAILPTLFWFGHTGLARAIVHIITGGVFFSGFAKDFFCLPRPQSPPVHRITMSGSAALEYGFPSTHSTNAIAVTIYCLAYLRAVTDMNPTLRLSLQLLAWVYGVTIILGRLYCGMHGFLDVIVGSALGAFLGWVQWAFREQFDTFLYSGDWTVPVIVVVAICALVRIHPEPVDPCPCFDDGVASMGVIIGVDVGQWHYAHSRFSWNNPEPATVPYSYAELGIIKSVVRVILGIAVILGWRAVMKPTLLSLLPPIFRFIERIGLSIPRRDYKQASEYTKVPTITDDTLPSLQEIPALIHNITRRQRSDSVGPQSAADAYETLAYREKRRRESIDSANGGLTSPSVGTRPAGHRRGGGTEGFGTGVSKYEREMGTVKPPEILVGGGGRGWGGEEKDGVVKGVKPDGGLVVDGRTVDGETEERREEAEMFMRIERPRVRYDVEVVTKLFVYAGIAWLAVEGNPVLFQLLGLGAGMRG